MIKKLVGFVMAVLCIVAVSSYAYGAEGVPDGLFEVTIRARGADREEALNGAIDEAIRKSLGSLFAERTELGGEMLEEKLIRFSRGTATNYKILESVSDESGVTLTVLVTVDSRKIKENARTVKEGSGSVGVEQWQSPRLEEGQKTIGKLLHGLSYERFLEVRLDEKKVDVRKGYLNVTVSLSFNRERYMQEFSAPLTAALDKIFASAVLQREIEGEFESPADRYAAAFSVLGENLSVHTWMLPRNFYDTIKREARFWDAGKGWARTHRCLWLHFSLLDEKGREIERLPLQLRVSNMIFFSEDRKESSNPWFFMDMTEPAGKIYPTLIAAPFFGTFTGKEYSFFEEYSQPFVFQLPESLLRQISDIRVSIELER